MIIHNQKAGRSRLDFNAVTYDLATTPGSVIIGGSLVLANAEVAVSHTEVLAADLVIYLKSDGTLVATYDADCVAQLCWWDGTDLHAIHHE